MNGVSPNSDQAPSVAAPPSFASVLKSREVEDPINLWVHRPLAYAFVRAVYRTSITPNQVTFLAMSLGLTAAGCWVWGSPRAMLVGGALLWISAIMDGADGILARAKKMSSAFGRALDGVADMVVGFTSSLAAVWHMSQQGRFELPVILFAGIVGVVCAVFHFNLYDAYKELFLRATRLGAGGESHSVEEISELNKTSLVNSAAWYTRFAMAFYEDYLGKQERFTERTNPWGARLLKARWSVDAEASELYRQHNAAPMRLWISISLAPHSYLFAIAGMLDMLLPYMVLRLTLFNAVALVALLLQRRASRKTLAAYTERGLVR